MMKRLVATLSGLMLTLGLLAGPASAAGPDHTIYCSVDGGPGPSEYHYGSQVRLRAKAGWGCTDRLDWQETRGMIQRKDHRGVWIQWGNASVSYVPATQGTLQMFTACASGWYRTYINLKGGHTGDTNELKDWSPQVYLDCK